MLWMGYDELNQVYNFSNRFLRQLRCELPNEQGPRMLCFCVRILAPLPRAV